MSQYHKDEALLHCEHTPKSLRHFSHWLVSFYFTLRFHSSFGWFGKKLGTKKMNVKYCMKINVYSIFVLGCHFGSNKQGLYSWINLAYLEVGKYCFGHLCCYNCLLSWQKNRQDLIFSWRELHLILHLFYSWPALWWKVLVSSYSNCNCPYLECSLTI